MTTPAALDDVRTLLLEGEVDLALTRVLSLERSLSPARANEARLLAARWNIHRRKWFAGTVSTDDNRVQTLQVIEAFQAFLPAFERDLGRVPIATSPHPREYQLPGGGADGYEKLIGAVSNLRSLAWIRRGLAASRAVCRIALDDGSRGTGFLASPRHVVTNHHVLPTEDAARRAVFSFDYEEELDGTIRPSANYSSVSGSWRWSEKFDCAVVELEDRVEMPLSDWGTLQLAAKEPEIGSHVIIIQHPNGDPKQIAVTDNRVINRFEHRLQYTTDTLPGSSGAPVFDDRWHVTAVHHAGGNLVKNAQGDRLYANEGILVRYIKEALGL